VKLLLDTHVWLWMVTAPERLAGPVRALLEDGSNELFLSTASGWEIAIKYSLGRLPLPEPPATFIPPRLIRDAVRPLPVELGHALAVAGLPRHHRDPFDRLLIAQAVQEEMALVTADCALAAYDVALIQT
jgi:PIN domain nuclease of toxin-antitoxin system